MFPQHKSIGTTVYVYGLPNFVSKEELNDIFRKFGRIKRIWVSNRQPNYAFIVFNNYLDAESSVKALDGTRILGLKASVKISYCKLRRTGSFNYTFNDSNRGGHNNDRSRSPDNYKYSRFSKFVNFLLSIIFCGHFSAKSSHVDTLEISVGSSECIGGDECSSDTQLFNCLVCDEQFPLNNIVFCNLNFHSSQSSNQQVHSFCIECVCGHASAAVGDVPMAKGGIGLRCMMPKCDNPILYSEIRLILSEDLQIKLEERILQESIGMASIVNLERCKKCNFAIEMEVDKEINKVFDCFGCGYQMCRLCEREWEGEHFGLSCKELDEKNIKDKNERELEKQLNEAIVRKCPRCGIQFVKRDGCNKMTCRCGMTQCYICRESDITYLHYCPHLRDPDNPGCKECKKTCLLYEDADKKDEQLIKEIREKGIIPVQNVTNVSLCNQIIQWITTGFQYLANKLFVLLSILIN